MGKRVAYYLPAVVFGLLLFGGAASPVVDYVCDMGMEDAVHRACCCEKMDVHEAMMPQMEAHRACCCIKQADPDQQPSRSALPAAHSPSQLLASAPLAHHSDLPGFGDDAGSLWTDYDGATEPSHVSLFLLNSTFLI